MGAASPKYDACAERNKKDMSNVEKDSGSTASRVSNPGDGSSRDTGIFVVIVNGDAVKVQVSAEQPLAAIIPVALENANVTGRPPEDWDIKDEQGNLYDRNRLVSDYDFPVGQVIYLSLRAGEAGM
ncbi:MAG: DUF2604 domain-containing protein [Armatimonas sp.]